MPERLAPHLGDVHRRRCGANPLKATKFRWSGRWERYETKELALRPSPWLEGPHSIGLANGVIFRSRLHHFQYSSAQLRSGLFKMLVTEQVVDHFGGSIVASGNTGLQPGRAQRKDFSRGVIQGIVGGAFGPSTGLHAGGG